MKHSSRSYNGYDRDSDIGNDWTIEVVYTVAEAHVTCYSVRSLFSSLVFVNRTNQVNPSWTVNPCWAVDPC